MVLCFVTIIVNCCPDELQTMAKWPERGRRLRRMKSHKKMTGASALEILSFTDIRKSYFNLFSSYSNKISFGFFWGFLASQNHAIKIHGRTKQRKRPNGNMLRHKLMNSKMK